AAAPADGNDSIGAALTDKIIRGVEFETARAVDRAAIKADEARMRASIKVRESAAEQNLIIRLNQNGVYQTVRAETEVNLRVGGAIGVKPGDVISGNGIAERELAADQNAAIRLKCDGRDEIVRPQAGVERVVQSAIRI